MFMRLAQNVICTHYGQPEMDQSDHRDIRGYVD